MSRILDAKNFHWTPSWSTDITVTLRKYGFKPTPPRERLRPGPALKLRAPHAVGGATPAWLKAVEETPA
jgi:hypothetical protein